jgi:enoyl-CoA hydratase/carnithine racemase
MALENVLVSKAERICTLTLNRPKVMNALNMDLVQDLRKAVEQVAADDDIRVIVFEGAGGNFCAGADVAHFIEDRPSPEWLDGMRQLAALIRRMREIQPPIITKLQGVAIGGGANLALVGDFVVAAHNARFCENFVHIGVILDAGGTFFLPRLVGLAKAREMALLGEEISGQKAAQMGLVYKSVPEAELDQAVADLAAKLAQKPLTSLGSIKTGLDKSFNQTLSDILEWEAALQSIMLRTPEHRGIVQMFMEMQDQTKK